MYRKKVTINSRHHLYRIKFREIGQILRTG